MSISAILGEALFVAHRLRRELLVGAPVAMVAAIVVMIVRNWPHPH